ncbi:MULTISPECIES: peptidoglycan-associated lipoprotein Pal [Silvimonas]|uniref:peptidoglycan-associated lipoprotein Pal n=1 Tax=Silvimonas TaxID=300264 RepID=UPI0024B3AD4D|nr:MULTISPECIES: peptidoglycan-associated lipoprotein Pal [Silvimonas]MDR3429785.1 peptidoglycan-associated lipoprotein Pal [Silvimonas sp.]
MKKILMSALLTALLAACASSPKPAPVTTGTTTPPAADTKPATVDLTQGKALPAGYSALTDPNNILSQRNVYFAFDSYVVDSKFSDLVQAHAKYLLEHKDAKIILQGNTDNRGTAEYNMALGQKRAEAVKKQLSALGVPDSQIETVSFGKEKPLEQGDTEEAWSRNRRAQIVYNGESAQ